MKKLLIIICIITSTLFTLRVKAQTVIDGKHWHSTTSTNGKLTIPEHSVVTYVGATVNKPVGVSIMLGNIAYAFVLNGVAGNYLFTGELYTGEQPMEIAIDKDNRESTITVSYYN